MSAQQNPNEVLIHFKIKNIFLLLLKSALPLRDYPIREQYTNLYKVIQNTGMVNSSEEGFQRVLANLTGEFAFIHDASEVKYQFYHNCNLTEIGEPFAEQPYAVAIQQGSHLHDEISKVILELQKDRYFESLKSRSRFF